MSEYEINNYTYENIIRKIADILKLGEPFWSGESLQMLCPFHKEGNASFGINADNGAYHCFACGAKGHISKISNNLRSNIIREEIDNILDFKISSKIDTVSYSSKPSGNEMGSIRNRFVSIPLQKYTISNLINLITTGHSVSPSGAKKNAEWTGQQLCMIDIDNDYAGINLSDVIEYAKSINLEPSFAYYTFNSTDSVQRFRLAYIFKEKITEAKLYQAIIDNLINKFEKYGADKQCGDLSRFFFGTTNTDVYISNSIYTTRFTSEQLFLVGKAVYLCSGKSKKSTSKKADINNINTDVADEESEFFINGKFQHNIFGRYMINKYHIIRLNNNLLYLYKDGIYVNDNETGDIAREMTKTIDRLNNRQIDEAMGYIYRMAEQKAESSFEFIAFTNGILNILTMNFIPFTPDIIVTSRVNAEYVPYDISSTNPLVDKFFDDITCHNKDLELLLYEIIGYACCRTNMFALSFIMLGNGRKSEKAHILKSLLNYLAIVLLAFV